MKLSALLLPALLLASCTSVVTGPGETGGSSTGGSSTGGSSTGGSSTTGECAIGDCGPTGFCHFTYAACMDTTWQGGQYTGTCQPRPEDCPAIYEPVCACNGQVYPNGCYANQDGQDMAAGACSPALTPSGFIPCGPIFCDPLATYCTVTHGDVGDTFWNCMELPSACMGTMPDCACLGQIQGEYMCTVEQGQDVSGLLVVTSSI